MWSEGALLCIIFSSAKGGHFQNMMPARRADGRSGGHFEKYNAHILLSKVFPTVF
jgi:hypothetical protein